MKRVKVLKRATGEIILGNVNVADTFVKRFKGLMGKDGLCLGEALLIRPCNSVHSFHMKFLFDVAFIDQNNKVVHIIHSMKPRKASPVIKGAKFVIETSGDYLKNRLKVGDEIEII